MSSPLFKPLKVGALTLPNRLVVAPLTRTRAGDVRVPNALMAEYYKQRAEFGLIITEATSISPMGVGYPRTPGVWSGEQVKGWRKVTTAVHEAGGRILLQLWHVGRLSDPMYLNGKQPVAPSAVTPAGRLSLVRPEKAYVTPRALETKEVKELVQEFHRAAQNAKEAGFDGVQLHGANGYILDQFLQDKTNLRDDEYGGSVENRARLMLEATDACIDVWGKDRVGMHLAPRGDSHDMGDSDRVKTFTYVGRELGKRGIAFIAAREYLGEDSIGPQIKDAFGGVFIANERFTKETAEQIIEKGEADAVAFGQLSIANPDLVKRFKLNAQLNKPDFQTLYAPDAKGYTDYPLLGEGSHGRA